MKKNLLAFAAVVILLLTTSVPAMAIEPRVQFASPTLEFDGTTAKCKVTVTSPGDQIYATLSLWNGTTLIDSWSASGTTVVFISDSCKVIKGQTYTLKVAGTINNVAFTGPSSSGSC